MVFLVVVAVFLVVVTNASAARPSHHTAEVRANHAVDLLCGGGWWVCMKRYPVDVFYNCGRNGLCWNVCYTHREKPIIGKAHYKCSTGQIKYRSGFITYYFEY